jgi:hypothetical protein
MTYRQEIGRVTTAVAELLLDGGTVPGDDIRAAVAGHSALVSLLRRVDKDLGFEDPHSRTLAHQLEKQPRVADQALTDVLQATSSSRAGELWRVVAKSATVAEHDWSDAVPISRPTGEQAEAEMADVAALTEAVAVLNGDIADSLNATARWVDAADFRASQTPLLIASRTLRSYLGVGPRKRPVPDLLPSTVDSILISRSVADLPESFHRLARILATTDPPPQHVDLIASAVADATYSAAATLGTTKNASSSVLLEHASRLASATGHSRRIHALDPGNGAALAQMNAIYKVLKNLPRQTPTQARATARHVAQGVPDITRELANIVERQIKNGQWLLRQEGTGITWNVSLGTDDEPVMLHHFWHAAAHSETLRKELSFNQGVKRQVAPSPRELLAEPLKQLTPASLLE